MLPRQCQQKKTKMRVRSRYPSQNTKVEAASKVCLRTWSRSLVNRWRYIVAAVITVVTTETYPALHIGGLLCQTQFLSKFLTWHFYKKFPNYMQSLACPSLGMLPRQLFLSFVVTPSSMPLALVDASSREAYVSFARFTCFFYIAFTMCKWKNLKANLTLALTRPSVQLEYLCQFRPRHTENFHISITLSKFETNIVFRTFPVFHK